MTTDERFDTTQQRAGEPIETILPMTEPVLEHEATRDTATVDVPFAPASHRLGESPNWVVGVIDDPEEANTAYKAAIAAGVAKEDIVLLSGPGATAVVEEKEACMSPLARLYARVTQVATDPGNAEREYREEAAQGHAILSIRAESSGQIVRAQEVLMAHHAHRVKHFGQWTLIDLAH